MFWFIIFLSLIAGGATSIFQSGMFGLSGMLPSRYTQVRVPIFVREGKASMYTLIHILK